MKTAVVAMLFAVFGLFATWSSVKLGSLINWPALLQVTPSGCDIEHCNVGWLTGAFILAGLLAPTATHGIVGWQLSHRGSSKVQYVTALGLLWVTTVALFMVFSLVAYRPWSN
jgi:hypothetical protein